MPYSAYRFRQRQIVCTEPNPMTGSTDLMSATTSAFAILAALNYRQQTGYGQYIDLSSVESLAVFTGDALMEYIMNGRVQSRNSNRDRIMAPHNCYRCQGEDKWVSIAVANDDEWQALCQAAGNPEWAMDERFADVFGRWKNQEELDRIIAGWTISLTHYEVTQILQKAGVAAMPSFSNAEIFADPHFKERGLAVEVQHIQPWGSRLFWGRPGASQRHPARVTRSAPLIGEHNEYVFGELIGMPTKEISRLVDEEVIF